MSSAADTKAKHPTALEIIQRDGLEGNLIGKVIVLTGATAGIGIEIARALSKTGATLILTARNRRKAESNLDDLLQSDHITLVDMDNESLDSVRAAAKAILAESNNKINILVANAGISGSDNLTLTSDSFERTFATNHLSHFLLFQLLKPALLAASTPSSNSRVVLTTSSMHRITTLRDSDDYNYEKGQFNVMEAYAHSKLANIYMANEIERRYGSRGLHGLSAHPGVIRTEIARDMDPEVATHVQSDPKYLAMEVTAEEGAATTVIAAVGKAWEGKGGKYLEECEEAKPGPDDGDFFGLGWVKQTYDEQSEARLWRDSLKLVGVKDD